MCQTKTVHKLKSALSEGEHVFAAAPKRWLGLVSCWCLQSRLCIAFLGDFSCSLQCWKMCLFVLECSILPIWSFELFHKQVWLCFVGGCTKKQEGNNGWSWNAFLKVFMRCGQVLLDLLLSWANQFAQRSWVWQNNRNKVTFWYVSLSGKGDSKTSESVWELQADPGSCLGCEREQAFPGGHSKPLGKGNACEICTTNLSYHLRKSVLL